MSHFFKHILIYAATICLTVVLCVSCQSEPAPNGSEEIHFAVGDVSRATSTDISTMTEAPFAVFSDMYSPTFSSLTVIHDCTPVNYVKGSWQYTGTQYWFPQHEHSFVAVHPASVVAAAGNPQYNNSRLSFSYTYPQDYRSATDILVSTYRRYYDENPDRKVLPVSFRFHHILSQLEPVVTLTDPSHEPETVVITRMVFKNVNTSGNYTVAPASLLANRTQTDDSADEGWSFTEKDRGDVTITFAETGSNLPNRVTPDETPHPILADNDHLMLLPVAKGNPVELVITYKHYSGSEDPEETTVKETFTQGWEAGKRYVLSLSMIRGAMQFSIEMKDWEDTEPIDTQVPRR